MYTNVRRDAGVPCCPWHAPRSCPASKVRFLAGGVPVTMGADGVWKVEQADRGRTCCGVCWLWPVRCVANSACQNVVTLNTHASSPRTRARLAPTHAHARLAPMHARTPRAHARAHASRPRTRARLAPTHASRPRTRARLAPIVDALCSSCNAGGTALRPFRDRLSSDTRTQAASTAVYQRRRRASRSGRRVRGRRAATAASRRQT
jgi:hypothetical protein